MSHRTDTIATRGIHRRYRHTASTETAREERCTKNGRSREDSTKAFEEEPFAV